MNMLGLAKRTRARFLLTSTSEVVFGPFVVVLAFAQYIVSLAQTEVLLELGSQAFIRKSTSGQYDGQL